jgi:hypothetical protein
MIIEIVEQLANVDIEEQVVSVVELGIVHEIQTYTGELLVIDGGTF